MIPKPDPSDPPRSLSATTAAPFPSPARFYVVVFAAAFLVRAAWGVFRLTTASDPMVLEFPDERQYWFMASSLASGSGLVDEMGFRATRMPLYPAMLALFASWPYGIVAAKVLHWLLGAGVAVLAASLAGRLFDRSTSLVAAAIVALDPFLVFFSSLLLTETLFLLALLMFWRCGVSVWMDGGDSVPRRRWIQLGFAAAFVIHTREAGGAFIGASLLAYWCARRFDARSLGGMAMVVLIAAASLLPWAWRNQTAIGEWRFLTTRGGVSLFDGVGPQADGSSNLGGVQQGDAVADLSEVAWSRYFMEQSLQSMRDDPWRILSLAVTKLGRTWNPLPNVDAYQSKLVRWVSAIWTLPILLFSVVGGIIVTKRGWGGAGFTSVAMLLTPALVVCVLHSVFVGSVRYRIPAMPTLEILAAVGLVHSFRSLALWIRVGLSGVLR